MISPNALLSHLISETWAMDPVYLETFLNNLMMQVGNMANTQAFMLPTDQQASAGYTVDKNGTAHIDITGVMLKTVPWIMKVLGASATSTIETRDNLNKALNDKDVENISLNIDSPGGTVSGVQELADDVRRGKEIKPVNVNVSDKMASAAYWVGSQAETITANKTAMVGSIGVYSVVEDKSEMASKIGLKVHVVSSHELKGTGVPGAEVTDKQLKNIQENVNGLAALFVKAVAEGRDMEKSEVKKSATGEVWLADEAKKRGLIDKIGAEEPEDEEDKKKKEDNPEEPDDDEKKKKEEEEKDASESTDADNKPALIVGAHEELDMSDKEKSELKATLEENAKLKEDLALAEAQAEEIRRQLCADVISRAQSEGKISPPQLEHCNDFAKGSKFDAKKVTDFISTLTVQTHPDPDTEQPNDDNKDNPKSGIESVDPELVAVMRKLGNSDAEIMQWHDVERVTHDGKMIRYDGSIKEVN